MFLRTGAFFSSILSEFLKNLVALQEAFKTRLMEDDNMIIYKKPADLPAWARPTVDKLIARGSIKPEADGAVNISQDMARMLVINDREGLYR